MSSIQTGTDQPQRLTRQQLRYQKRRLAGLCCYGNCAQKTVNGRSCCESHLRQKAHHISTIYNRRKDQKLCRDCGMRPRYWGRRCLICRQSVSKDPLPRQARMELRKYREQQAQDDRAKTREMVRTAAREWMARTHLREREREALTLYLGLHDNEWRTYKQVAQLMRLSGERVRQLLVPSRDALGSVLGDSTPWRLKRSKRQTLPSNSWSIDGTERCAHSQVKVLRQSLDYREVGLPNVTLQGVPVSLCQECAFKNSRIPRQEELHTKLARALLRRSHLLSGQEIRFLRKVGGLNAAEFAQRLDVTSQTVRRWETSQSLSFANDIAVRMVLASILDMELSSQTFTLPHVMPDKDLGQTVITAKWTSGSWKLESQRPTSLTTQ